MANRDAVKDLTKKITALLPENVQQMQDDLESNIHAVLQNALFPGPAKRISRLVIPRCIYTDPEIAHVGLSAGDAADRPSVPRGHPKSHWTGTPDRPACAGMTMI